MAAINFPDSPTVGDTFTASDKTWVYLDGKWTLQPVETQFPVTISSATSGQFLKWNGTAWVNDTIDLGADTAGSFVTSLVAGTGVTLANNSGEASTPTVTVDTTVIAPLASPIFTGTPTAPTAAGGTNTTQIATTAFVTTSVGGATINSLDAIADVTITSATSGQFLKWNGTAWVNDAIDLGTDTTGSYVTSLVAGTGVTLANNSGEGATPTVTVDTSVIAPLASPTFTGTLTANNLTVSGDLTVSGTTTSINTEILTVDDNIIILNNNATGSPTVDAGIEVERGSSTNVKLIWNETTDKWQFTNDGSTYTDLGAGGATISDTPPASPIPGQVWFESDTAKTYVYYDSQWIEIGALAAAGIVTMSDTAPASPAGGKLWFNSSNAKTYVYYDSAWVEIGASSNPAALNDIGDVTITSATNGQFLKWNGSAWVNDAITATVLASGAANTYVLMADSTTASGVKWAVIPPSGGLSTTTEGAIMTMNIGG